MLVESLEGANEDPTVLQDAPHPVVDVLQHLAALAHSLQEISREEREAWICSTHSCIHWLTPTCALTGDCTGNLGVSGLHFKQLSYPARVEPHIPAAFFSTDLSFLVQLQSFPRNSPMLPCVQS